MAETEDRDDALAHLQEAARLLAEGRTLASEIRSAVGDEHIAEHAESLATTLGAHYGRLTNLAGELSDDPDGLAAAAQRLRVAHAELDVAMDSWIRLDERLDADDGWSGGTATLDGAGQRIDVAQHHLQWAMYNADPDSNVPDRVGGPPVG